MHTNPHSTALLAVALSVLASVPIAQPRAQQRSVAITFDDLPATAVAAVANDAASLEALTRKLLTAVRAHDIPAVGFVNEGKLFVGGGDRARRIGLLTMWLDAGLELGNHTYSHRDLNTVP